MGPSSFSTWIASVANSSQRHKTSKLPLLFPQFLEVNRLQNMPVDIPTAQIPVVTGGSVFILLPHDSGADFTHRFPTSLTRKGYSVEFYPLELTSTQVLPKVLFCEGNIHMQDPERYPHGMRSILGRRLPSKELCARTVLL